MIDGRMEEETLATNPMRLSADDLLDITVPDHLRGHELVDGGIVEVSHVSPVHARLAAQIAHRMLEHVERERIDGAVYVQVGCVLGLPHDPERSRAPDVAFVAGDTLRQRGGEPERGLFRLTPDLVVEVDSPNRRPSVEQNRIQDWLDAGVRLLWVVHTASRSSTVYRPDGTARLLRESDVLEGETVLPGFRLPLAELFVGSH